MLDIFDFFDSLTIDLPKFISRRLKPATWTKAIVYVLWNIFVLVAAGAVIIGGYALYVKLTS